MNPFYKDKLVLVTGGTGLVGAHIVEELLKHGARVRVPVHKRPPVVEGPTIEYVGADLNRPEDCVAAAKGVDYVFHAAGAVGFAGASAVDSMGGVTANLVLTARMLHAAWVEHVARFLLMSSSTVYPLSDYPIKEEEAWSGPTYPSYFGYGWMKRYLEKLAEYVAAHSQVKIGIVRPSALYGRWDNFDSAGSHVIPALIRKALERQDPFQVWGSGEEVRDFLHVSDLARGTLLVLEKYATCEPINLGYGRGVTIREIVGIILKAAGYQGANVAFDISRPTTIPFRMVDTSKAKRLLDFEPQVSIEQGLTDTVNWYARRSSQAGTGVNAMSPMLKNWIV
jgi:GDP-L-fucose synthase